MCCAESGDDFGDGVPGRFLVGLDVYSGGGVEAGMDGIAQRVDVDRASIDIGVAGLGEADDGKILRGGLDLSDFGNLNIEAELHDVGGDHENDEQDENHVDERDDVDIGVRRERAETAAAAWSESTIIGGESHYSPKSLSAMFWNSMAKSSMRVPNSLMLVPYRL